MLLDYESPSASRCRLGLAAIAAFFAIAWYLLTGWCVFHAFHVNAELAKLSGAMCGNYIDEVISSLGLPLETTIQTGAVSGAFGLVATIQSIRWYNGALGRRSREQHNKESRREINSRLSAG